MGISQGFPLKDYGEPAWSRTILYWIKMMMRRTQSCFIRLYHSRSRGNCLWVCCIHGG